MNQNILILIIIGIAASIFDVLTNPEAVSVASVMDALVVVVGIAAIYFGRIIGGKFGSELKWVFFGFVILVFAHSLETIIFSIKLLGQDDGEILHRLIVLIGFGSMALGFYKIEQSTKKITN